MSSSHDHLPTHEASRRQLPDATADLVPEDSPRPIPAEPDLGQHPLPEDTAPAAGINTASDAAARLSSDLSPDTPSAAVISKADEARRRFLDGANCAQAVLCSFADACGLDQRTASHLATGFGAGFGRLREVCGAVSAMTMVAGLLHGADADDKTAKDDCYAWVQRLANEFRDQAGSIICRELLGLPAGQSDAPISEARTPDYYRRRHRTCCEKVMLAAAILERELPNLRHPTAH